MSRYHMFVELLNYRNYTICSHIKTTTLNNFNSYSMSPKQHIVRLTICSWLHKWTSIYFHLLHIILRLLFSPLGRWIHSLMICINTCQCFVSHWYQMNFKHWLFFAVHFPASHKMSFPDTQCRFCLLFFLKLH